MDIERWFETMPSHVVNDIAREKRFIGFAIHNPNSLNFENQNYLIKDILSMSRKVKNAKLEEKPVTTPSNPSRKDGNSATSKTRWATVDIRSGEHKKAVRELSTNVNFVLDTLVELVDDGYELHIKRTDAGSTIRTMLFCKIVDHPNENGGLSAEAPDAWLSLSAIVYKHVTVLDGLWFSDDDEGGESDGWR